MRHHYESLPAADTLHVFFPQGSYPQKDGCVANRRTPIVTISLSVVKPISEKTGCQAKIVKYYDYTL